MSTTIMRQDPETGRFQKTKREYIVSNYLRERGDWRARLASWLLF